MNQKFELPQRVERRGSAELGKVLAFIAKACEVLIEINSEFERQERE